MADPNVYEIYTDGACSGNPGPGGWGVFITHRGVEKDLSGGERQTTNNRMEMQAAIEAMKAVPEGATIILHTDSQYLKNGLTQWIHGWKRNGWKTAARKPVKNRELWQELDRLCAARTVTWKWVKGHAGDPGNERADALANQGMASVR